MAAEYKYKPYQPKNLKLASVAANKEQAEIQRLETQKRNLDQRLRNQGIDPDTLDGGFDNRNLIEKALNLPAGQGPLMDFFEIWNRPVEAIKAGIMAGYEGEDVLEASLDALSSARMGATPGSEVAEKLLGIDIKDGGEKFAFSIAADILLDPLTYLPAGFFLKRIGKLFKKDKVKLIQELSGEVVTTVNTLNKLDGTKFAFRNIDELENFIKVGDATEVANLKSQFKTLAESSRTNLTVLELGKAGDFDPQKYLTQADYKYNNTLIGLQERSRWLKDTNAKIKGLDELKRLGQIDEATYAQRLQEILPDSFNGKIKDQVLAELQLLDEVSAGTAQLGDDYAAVMTSTSNRTDDVAILKKVQFGDEEYYVKVMSVDSKMAEGAAGATATIAFGTTVSGKTTVFAASEGAFQYADDLQDEFVTFLKNETVNFEGEELSMYDIMQKMSAGRRTTRSVKPIDIGDMSKNTKKAQAARKKLKKWYENLSADEQARLAGGKAFDALDTQELGNLANAYNATPLVNNSFNPYEALKAKYGEGTEEYLERKKKLDSILRRMNYAKHNNGKGYIYLANRDGASESIFARLEDISNETDDFLDFTQSSWGWTRSGGTDQFRFSTRLKMTSESRERLLAELPIDKRPGIGQILMDAELNPGLFEGRRRVVSMSILDILEEGEGFIADLATVANKVVKGFQGLFDPYAALPKETQVAIRRMRGRLAVEFQQKALRLAGLEKSFLQMFPDLDPALISKIVSSGAYIDAAGVIQYAARTVDAKDYVRYMLKSIEDGKPFQLREFANATDEANFVATLNDLMETVTGIDDVFEVVIKKGVKALGMSPKANVDDLKKLSQYLDANLRPVTLDYGKLILSSDAERVLREWDQIGEAVNLKNDIQKLLVQEGGFTNFLFDGAIDETYLRHIMTKEAYEYMVKNQPGVLSKFAKRGSNVFQERKFIGTIEEANNYLKAYYDVPMDVFDPNFFRSTEEFLNKAFRTVEQGKMIDILLTSKDKYGQQLMRVVPNTSDVRKALSPDDIMIKSFKDEFSAMHKNMSPETQEAFDKWLRSQGFQDNQAIIMNRSMHGILKQVEKAFIDLPDYIKVYDKFLNTWKGLTLITPGFHMRNLFGNSFNSYAVGMGIFDQMKYARLASLQLNQYDEFLKIIADGGTLTAKQQRLFDRVSAFKESGLLQSHRGIRDLEQVKDASIRGTAKVNENLYNRAIRFNFNLAEKMDDTQRFMLYSWALDKYGDTGKAIDTVAEALFDYSRLTGFEKDVMKRLFPFYTFMKNNFVFQAKNIFKNPQQYARVGRAYKYYLEDIAGYSPEELPTYATENMWLPIPMMVTKNDKEGIAFLKANLPISDFTELVANPFKKGVSSITTPIKLAIEIGAGRDMFTGAPLESFPGETNVMKSGEGVLSGIRDPKGSLAIAKTPIGQKILNDLGFRAPLQFASIGLDLLDVAAGYKGPTDGLTGFLQRTGMVSTQELEKVQITRLYQDLERLRELKKYYEQETGNQLPVLPR